MSGIEDFKDYSDALVANSSVKWGMGGGAATSIFGTLADNNVLVFVGVVTTALGFMVNLYYQYRRNKRAEEAHKLQLQLIEAQIAHEQKSTHED